MIADKSLRIGVYVCHCGSNIAGVVDVEALTQFAKGLPGVVVSRHYKYMCSDPGQELVKRDIAEHNLNRIVVAACSPNLHEPTFRRAAEDAGLNRFLVQMCNIREQVAWVTEDRSDALDKSKAHLAGAIRRVARHEPLQRQFVRIVPRAMVIGGGIAGIQAALTLADAGKEVILVEREPSIGGHMAMFDKTFPTLDCAACILTPKMTSVKLHPKIKMLTYSTVESVEGSVGNYRVKVRRKPRYIDEDLCVGCMQCIDACVFTKARFPNAFDQGLGLRKPVYLPFAQAVPPVPVVDPATCLQVTRGKCKQTCVEACGERNAFRFDEQERIEEYEVGAVIVATGFKAFDPSAIEYYGYGKYPNVYTSLEVERLLNAGGPTGGKLVLRDGSTPKRVGIVHCVGSRDANYHTYCSRVCCMYALKLAHLVREKTEAEVYNCYIDMRTPGKGFEEFYNRVQNEGVQFIRGKVADITPTPSGESGAGSSERGAGSREQGAGGCLPSPVLGRGAGGEGGCSGSLTMQVDDTLRGTIRKIEVDMVILAVALEPQADADDVRRTFGISCSSEGFFLEKHPKLAPVNTANDGVMVAGVVPGGQGHPRHGRPGRRRRRQGPGPDRRRADRVGAQHGLGRGRHVLRLQDLHFALSLQGDRPRRRAGIAVIDQALCKGCGTCVAACPSGAAKQHLFGDEQVNEELEGLMNYV